MVESPSSFSCTSLKKKIFFLKLVVFLRTDGRQAGEAGAGAGGRRQGRGGLEAAAARARGGGTEALSGAGGSGDAGPGRRRFGARGARRCAAGTRRVGCPRVIAVSPWSPTSCAQPGGQDAGAAGGAGNVRCPGARQAVSVWSPAEHARRPRDIQRRQGAGRRVGAETSRISWWPAGGPGRLARQQGPSVEALHPAARPSGPAGFRGEPQPQRRGAGAVALRAGRDGKARV